MTLLIVQLLLSLLVLNAIRPPRNPYLGAAASFPGMLLSEAPILGVALVLVGLALPLALGSAGTAAMIGIVLGLLNLIGLSYLLLRSRRVIGAAASAIAQTPGVDNSPLPEVRLRSVLLPFSHKASGVQVHRNIAYGDAPKKRNLLDIYVPSGEQPSNAPVLLQIHGGSWMYGSKEQQARPLLNKMSEQGWVCVAINYRLAPANPWPAHIVDVKQAIAWVKQNIASYGGNPDHIVLTGGSAGGHLSALAALSANDPAYQPGFETEDTSVAGAVPLYGVYDIAAASDVASAPGLRDFMGKRVLQADPQTDLEPFIAASPIARVSEQAPDFFVLHGTQDSTADINQSRELVNRLRAQSKREVAYCEVPNAQHMFDTFRSPRCDAVVEAISRWLNARHSVG